MAKYLLSYDEQDVKNGNLDVSPDGVLKSAGKGPAMVTVLHITVMSYDNVADTATIIADKTPSEMNLAAAEGPIWCTVTIPKGVINSEQSTPMTIGLALGYAGGEPVFGSFVLQPHDSDSGDNVTVHTVHPKSNTEWLLNVSYLGS